jgi:hypothetical protein
MKNYLRLENKIKRNVKTIKINNENTNQDMTYTV